MARQINKAASIIEKTYRSSVAIPKIIFREGLNLILILSG